MSEKSDKVDLGDRLSEIESHHRVGEQRVKAWYNDSEDPPEKLNQLDRPPHQYIIEDAAAMLEHAATRMYSGHEVITDQPLASTYRYVLLGTGTEILLTGIHLKLSPDTFIEKMDESSRMKTPSFGDSRGVLIQVLADELSNEQKGRICRVLKLMRAKRNNLVHFGFHQMTHHDLEPPIYEVLAFLINRYSEEELKEAATLSEKAAELRRRNSGMQPSEITFDTP